MRLKTIGHDIMSLSRLAIMRTTPICSTYRATSMYTCTNSRYRKPASCFASVHDRATAAQAARDCCAALFRFASRRCPVAVYLNPTALSVPSSTMASLSLSTTSPAFRRLCFLFLSQTVCHHGLSMPSLSMLFALPQLPA